jgi:hypothetical protein
MNQTETKDNSAKTKKFIAKLLEGYFHFRKNLPTDGYVQENRTTRQIQDDLSEMYYVSLEDIANYMLEHEYGTLTEPDGRLVWAIWRKI